MNERKFYTLMQESGIEKDDLQTMFNVLDADDSGEVGGTLVTESGIVELCVSVFFFLPVFFCWMGGGGAGRELGWEP